MSNQNLFSAVDRVAASRGAADCWRMSNDDVLSYADLRRRVGEFAAALAQLGVAPGERVVAQVEKSPQALLSYLACVKLGAVWVPLNTAYTDTEVEYFLSDSQPVLLICDAARRDSLSQIAARLQIRSVTALNRDGSGELESLAKSLCDSDLAQNAIEQRSADDVAAILYTSGTTGRSKGAMLTHGNLLANAKTLIEQWGFSSDDVLLHALPVFHVHGLFVATHCALLSGAATLLQPRFDVDDVFAALEHSSVMMGVPTFYTRLLADSRLSLRTVRQVRLFICGSAPLLTQTFEEFEARTGQRILERYGMTEAGMITSNPLSGERVAGTVGFPLSDVSLRIADVGGVPLPVNTPGVIEIQGPNVFAGYWRRPDRSADFRSDGYFITGDVAIQDATGRVTIVGRAKDLIISGGFNIYPREIEQLLDAIPNVVESAVIGVPHADFGEAVVAVIAARPEHDLSERAILDALSGTLARFKQPKRVIFVRDLPRNAMGKVQKKLLRESYVDLFRVAIS